MPLVESSSYHSPDHPFFAHAETVYPALFRKIRPPGSRPVRIDTSDGDFLDLEISLRKEAPAMAVVCHGLEGNSRKPYVVGMARALEALGWSVLRWNYRGCSGALNHQPVFYHSGATADLDAVVRYALGELKQERIALIGFSLGGNLLLKYLGEGGWESANKIMAAVAISVPLELGSSCRKLSVGFNRLYEYRFLRGLDAKLRAKIRQFPGLLKQARRPARSLYEFDDLYTAPLHGFRDAQDYYQRCSSLHYLDGIKAKTLVINAKNDPMLSEACFPYGKFSALENVFFETPDGGGHVGFCRHSRNGRYWTEERTAGFLTWALNGHSSVPASDEP
jgi:uncharacterized protein